MAILVRHLLRRAKNTTDKNAKKATFIRYLLRRAKNTTDKNAKKATFIRRPFFFKPNAPPCRPTVGTNATKDNLSSAFTTLSSAFV
jgi:hypothetical protein